MQTAYRYKEATLLRDLDRALAAEGCGIESLLRQTSELRAIAAVGLCTLTQVDP